EGTGGLLSGRNDQWPRSLSVTVISVAAVAVNALSNATAITIGNPLMAWAAARTGGQCDRVGWRLDSFRASRLLRAISRSQLRECGSGRLFPSRNRVHADRGRRNRRVRDRIRKLRRPNGGRLEHAHAVLGKGLNLNVAERAAVGN